MRRVIIGNPITDSTYKSFLSSQYTSGTSLSLLSTVTFQANDLIIAGEVGEELTELQTIDSISSKILAILKASGFSFSHPKDTPIYRVLWNMVEIEGRSSSAGTFATITQSSIQWDKRDTIYYHQAGTDSWEYRFRFLNSVTGQYSDYSPTAKGTGFTSSQVGFMINQVRQITLDFDGRVATDAEIMNWFNTAQQVIEARNPYYWFLKVDTYQTNNPITIVANQSVYSLASYTDLSQLDSLRARYTSGSVDTLYHLEVKPAVEFDRLTRNLNRPALLYMRMFKIIPADASSDQGYIQLDPIPKEDGTGLLYPVYYKNIPDLINIVDATIVPIPSLLQHYAIAQMEKIKGNEQKADLYLGLFWGPSDKAVSSSRLQGLPLLDQMDQGKNRTKQPRQLMSYRGQKAVRSLYGEFYAGSLDDIRERYF